MGFLGVRGEGVSGIANPLQRAIANPLQRARVVETLARARTSPEERGLMVDG